MVWPLRWYGGEIRKLHFLGCIATMISSISDQHLTDKTMILSPKHVPTNMRFHIFSRKKTSFQPLNIAPLGHPGRISPRHQRHRPRCPGASPCGFWSMESPTARREPRNAQTTRCDDTRRPGTALLARRWDMMGFYVWMHHGRWWWITIFSRVTHGDLWSSWIKIHENMIRICERICCYLWYLWSYSPWKTCPKRCGTRMVSRSNNDLHAWVERLNPKKSTLQ